MWRDNCPEAEKSWVDAIPAHSLDLLSNFDSRPLRQRARDSGGQDKRVEIHNLGVKSLVASLEKSGEPLECEWGNSWSVREWGNPRNVKSCADMGT